MCHSTFSFMQYLGIVVNIAIAIAAIWAATTANHSLKLTREFKKDEDQKKRAFLTPINRSVIFGKGNGASNKLEFEFQNYGINPTTEVNIDLIGFMIFSDHGKDNITDEFSVHRKSINPIPSGGSWIVNLTPVSTEMVSERLEDLEVIDHLILRAYYKDPLLDKFYENVHYWKIQDGGNLVEPNIENLEILQHWYEGFKNT